LVLLPLPVPLPEFAAFSMKDCSCQPMAFLSPVELDERPSALVVVIYIVDRVDGLVDAAEFRDRLGRFRRAVVDAQRLHN
jgi:hypothetical protein